MLIFIATVSLLSLTQAAVKRSVAECPASQAASTLRGSQIYEQNTAFCSYNETGGKWDQDTGYHMTCLVQEIVNEDLEDLDTVITERVDEIVAIFQGSDCWDNYLSTQDESSTDKSQTATELFSNTSPQSFDNFFDDSRNHLSSIPEDNVVLMNTMDDIQELVWEHIATHPEPAKCLIGAMQNNFVKYVEECAGRQMETPFILSGEGLGLLRIIPKTRAPAVRKMLELQIKGVLLAKHCPKDEIAGTCSKFDMISKKLLQRTMDRVCNCAEENIEFCPENYNFVCPFLDMCLTELEAKPQVLLKDLKTITTKCFKDAPDALGPMLRIGANVLGAAKNLTAEGNAALLGFVRDAVKSSFPTSICNQCHLDRKNEEL